MNDLLKRTSKKIWTCNKCNGCRFRTPPLPGIFPKNARVLIIAQNPGEGNDSMRESFKMEYMDFMRWYRDDFFSSRACKEIELLLDEKKWYSHVAYTNVVKCRTKNNEMPSEEMVEKCFDYLLDQISAMNISYIIAIGSLAKKACSKLRVKNIIFIPHYSYLRRQGKDYRDFSKVAVRFVSEAEAYD